MLTLLGSLLGLGTTFLPKVLDYFQDKQDKAHELAMQDKIIEGQQSVAKIKLQATTTQAEIDEVIAGHKEQAATIREASRWLANLSGSIRPIVTYIFVTEFIMINAGIAWLTFAKEGVTIANLQGILNDDFMGLLSTMIMFWFGSREIRRREGKL